MLSTKTLATLLPFILNMQLAASSGTQEPSPSGTSTLLVKKPKSKLTPKLMLKDETDTTEAVQATEESTEGVVQVQEQPVPQVNKEFEALIKQEKYAEIFALGKNMKLEEFWEQLDPLVKISEQRERIVSHVTRAMRPIFYLYGDIEAIKSDLYVFDRTKGYFTNANLLEAFSLAFKQNLYDHFLKLLEVATWMTTEDDELLKMQGLETHFEHFLSQFFYDLAPEKDDMTLRRFLTFHGDDLKSKRPDSFDTIFQELVCHLREKPDAPNTEKLLIDIIGQPSMLTSVSFTKGFLKTTSDYPNFIKYGWREVIGENLEREYLKGVSNLWQAIRSKYPNEFSEEYPAPATEAFAIVLERFKTKQQKEEEWKERSLAPLSNKLKSLNIFPNVLCLIIAEYAVPFTVTEDPTISGK